MRSGRRNDGRLIGSCLWRCGGSPGPENRRGMEEGAVRPGAVAADGGTGCGHGDDACWQARGGGHAVHHTYRHSRSGQRHPLHPEVAEVSRQFGRQPESAVGHRRVEPEQGAQQQQWAGRCPGLRRARRRIRDRGRELGAVETAEELRQPSAEEGRRVDEPTGDPLGVLHEPVAHETRCHQGVVVRPDGAVVVAHRVVGSHGRRQRAHAPTGEHLGREQVLGDLRRLVLVDDSGPQAVAHVRGQAVDRTLVAVQAQGVPAALG
jgi:hypothetical protein